MRFTLFRLFLPCATLLVWSQVATPRAEAESVLLKNGNRIDGKVTDNRNTSGLVIVEIGESGRVTLRAEQVEKIEASAPADDGKGDHVSVTLSRGNEFYGTRAIDGKLSPQSDDTNLVLTLPGGKVKIPKSDVARITKVENEPMPVKNAADPVQPVRTIKTTHAVLLKNGRKLRGNLHKTQDFEPVKLVVGSLGVMSISRWQVAPDGILEEEGSIEMPAASEPAVTPAAKPPTPEESKAQMKRELRQEILREILDQLIEEKLEQAVDAQAAASSSEAVAPALTDAQTLEIRTAVRELTRQRSQNRVRAERQLKNLGSAVLPYLEAVASHPFELTRRAVQRLVRDLGDVRGAPLAIDALNDADGFVRELAGEALRQILPSSIAYSPTASERSRLRAQGEYRTLWDEAVRGQMRESILRDIALAH